MKNIFKLSIAFAILSCFGFEAACAQNNAQKTIETILEAKSENVTIDGSLGKLSAIIQTPAMKQNEKCPLVILMHGYMSNKNAGLITLLANKLQQTGIASLRFDFNAHGESEGEFVKMTVLNEIEDAKKVYEYVKTLPFVGKIALAGHSQGGVVAAMTSGELGAELIACAVLMAPAAVLKDDAINGKTFGVSYDSNNIPEYVEIFGQKLGREFIRTAQTLPIYETASLYTGPVCIIHGTSDEIVPYSYAERFHEICKNSQLHLVDGENHGFTKSLYSDIDIAVEFFLQHIRNSH